MSELSPPGGSEGYGACDDAFNWLLKCAEDWLKPVYEELYRQLVKREILHADETTLQVLHEPGKKPQSKSYMWLYRTGGDAEHPIVLYEYQPGRKRERPKEFLAGFRGYLHTDGYAGYHDLLEGITVVGCWAHARRYFDEAVKSLPKGKQPGSSAATGLAWCTKLFQEEKNWRSYRRKNGMRSGWNGRNRFWTLCFHGQKRGRRRPSPRWARHCTT